MPFGLSTAPATFQRSMDIILSGLTYVICLCYLDDVIVFGRDMNEHCERLETVCENSFSRLKLLLCSALILCYPRFDREFILQTDASDFGVGAVLSQVVDEGREKVVAYTSKALSARQRKFSATEKEAYAIVFGTQQFRVYLLGRHFQIVTDHNALRWLHTQQKIIFLLRKKFLI
jgi:hypothetical protein